MRLVHSMALEVLLHVGVDPEDPLQRHPTTEEHDVSNLRKEEIF